MTALAETFGISRIHECQCVEVIYRHVKQDSPYNIRVRLFGLGRAAFDAIVRRINYLNYSEKTKKS